MVVAKICTLLYICLFFPLNFLRIKRRQIISRYYYIYKGKKKRNDNSNNKKELSIKKKIKENMMREMKQIKVGIGSER